MSNFLHLRLALDIDLPTGELDRQANILTPPANRQRQLIVGNDHIHRSGILVDDHLGNLRRRKCAVHVAGRVFIPGHDIDALAPEFLHHRLDPAALHSHTGTHGIHIAIPG